MGSSNQEYEWVVDSNGERLDVWLQQKFQTQYSRNTIQNFIKNKKVTIIDSQGKVLPEKKIKPSFRLEKGMKVLCDFHEVSSSVNINPIPMNLNILYEDQYLAIIHKPPNISVHPGQSETNEPTILNGILFHWKELQNQPIVIQNKTIIQRPGIVHRLDKMTEGLLLVAKNPSTQWKLSRMFQTREIKKTYIAWLLGTPKEEKGRIELPLKRNPKNRNKMMVDPQGRMAITEYETIKAITSTHHRKYTKVRIHLITGRTHQIRAHFHHLKCPVVGDDLYYHVDEKIKKYGLLLLAKALSFVHPETQELVHVEIDEPKRFLEFEKKCHHY
ncbi:MAG: RluA family pseudouridine synthase [Leptospiraceae bacterium]|nr:RluA family pseudouridine synthase [Leptospiraceae bacterium]MDW7975046.1 RluA family pseudouridine synthase [Leptospiraceae bacterium]